MTEGEERGSAKGRPLIATWQRGVTFAAATAALAMTASVVRGGSLEGTAQNPIAIACVLFVAVVGWLQFRAGERRLTRELRIARTGTAAMRGLALRRRTSPWLTGWFVSSAGRAALLAANGERAPALLTVARDSFLLRSTRMGRLREIVESAATLVGGKPDELDRALALLDDLPPLDHPEADRYRTEVRLEAILARGDVERGRALFEGLAPADDEAARVARVWLAAWFELEGASPPTEADMRLAALLAHARGAEELATRLTARLGVTGAGSSSPEAPGSSPDRSDPS